MGCARRRHDTPVSSQVYSRCRRGFIKEIFRLAHCPQAPCRVRRLVYCCIRFLQPRYGIRYLSSQVAHGDAEFELTSLLVIRIRFSGDFPSSANALTLIGRLCTGTLLSALILLGEKFAIQFVAYKFHQRSYADRISHQKHQMECLVSCWCSLV